MLVRFTWLSRAHAGLPVRVVDDPEYVSLAGLLNLFASAPALGFRPLFSALLASSFGPAGLLSFPGCLHSSAILSLM